VVLIYIHSPQLEYARVPHSGTHLYALPTAEYAGVPHSGARFYALPAVDMQG
jgi:hypothetical protein